MPEYRIYATSWNFPNVEAYPESTLVEADDPEDAITKILDKEADDDAAESIESFTNRMYIAYPASFECVRKPKIVPVPR